MGGFPTESPAFPYKLTKKQEVTVKHTVNLHFFIIKGFGGNAPDRVEGRRPASGGHGGRKPFVAAAFGSFLRSSGERNNPPSGEAETPEYANTKNYDEPEL